MFWMSIDLKKYKDMSEAVRHESYIEKLMLFSERETFPHAIIIEDVNSEKALENVIFLTKFILCDSKSEKPCEKCGNCTKINNRCHMDVKILKPEKDFTSIKIAEIRKVREDAHIISLEGHKKFYIIEKAELMTDEAQNAFIKILEEPPKNLIFILICKSISALLPTVRSRCQIYLGNTGLDMAQEDSNINILAQDIVKYSMANDAENIMKLVAETSNDRNYLKLLAEMILHRLIRESANRGLKQRKIFEMIDELHSLIKIFENNININLLKCRIMAALIK